MATTSEQRDTTLGKSVGISDEQKLSADNVILIAILNSPIKEYRYNNFERSGRLSQNRVRDTKGTLTTFSSDSSCQFMIPTPIT